MSSPLAGTSAVTPTKSLSSDNVDDQLTNNANGTDSTSTKAVSTRPKVVTTSRHHRTSGSKSPEKCPICLSIPDDRSYTDSCYHEFCFVCLLEWSKVKSECPLCKQKFKNIIHNIRSIDDYDKYEIPEAAESFGIDDSGRRFRFPTTMTVERVELLRLIRQLHLQLEEMQRNNQIVQENRSMYMRQLARVRRLRHLFERSGERRERLTATSDFRRLVYERRLRAIPPAPGDGTRRCSPQFFNRNPACLNRLVPWLHRELNVLLSGEAGRVSFLMDMIRNMLIRWPIESEEARRFLSPYMGQYTDAFLHEFFNFARSPYDMEEYDRHVQYESWRDARARLRGPNEAPPEIVIGNSPPPDRHHDDSDILLSPGIAARAHNPSPPPYLSWPPAAARRSYVDRDAPVALLTRCQELLESNLMLLDSRRNIESMRRHQNVSLARQAFGDPASRRQTWNSTVELLSSSSDDDDSPKLDPNARTPPYLLRTRKRTAGSFPFNGKRRRLQAASEAHSSRLVNGAASSSIILDDNEGDEERYDRGTRPYQRSALPFSPAPVAMDSVIVDSDVDVISDSDMSSRGQVSAAFAGSSIEGTTPVLSSPSYIATSPVYSPAIAYSPSPVYSRSPVSSDRWSAVSYRSISPNRIGETIDSTPQPSYNWGSPHSSFSSWSNHRNNSSPLWNGSAISDRGASSSRTLSPINPDELQIVAELKPKAMRTPELVTLNDEEDVERKPSLAQLNAAFDGPSTSGTSRRSRSRSRERRHKHKKHRHHSSHRHGHKKSKKKRSKRHRRDAEDKERHRKSRSRREEPEDRRSPSMEQEMGQNRERCKSV